MFKKLFAKARLLRMTPVEREIASFRISMVTLGYHVRDWDDRKLIYHLLKVARMFAGYGIDPRDLDQISKVLLTGVREIVGDDQERGPNALKQELQQRQKSNKMEDFNNKVYSELVKRADEIGIERERIYRDAEGEGCVVMIGGVAFSGVDILIEAERKEKDGEVYSHKVTEVRNALDRRGRDIGIKTMKTEGKEVPEDAWKPQPARRENIVARWKLDKPFYLPFPYQRMALPTDVKPYEFVKDGSRKYIQVRNPETGRKTSTILDSTGRSITEAQYKEVANALNAAFCKGNEYRHLWL